MRSKCFYSASIEVNQKSTIKFSTHIHFCSPKMVVRAQNKQKPMGLRLRKKGKNIFFLKNGVCLIFVIFRTKFVCVCFDLLFCCISLLSEFRPIDYLRHLPPNFELDRTSSGYTNNNLTECILLFSAKQLTSLALDQIPLSLSLSLSFALSALSNFPIRLLSTHFDGQQ